MDSCTYLTRCSLAALSGNECLWFSLLLWLVTMSAARQTPGGSRTRVRSWSSRSLALCRLPKAWIHGCMTLTKMLVLICLYCLKCAKFDRLILVKIIKIVATTCQILRLKCTNFDFGWGSSPDLTGELTTLSRPPSSIKGAYF